jgi:hypothetical protein
MWLFAKIDRGVLDDGRLGPADEWRNRMQICPADVVVNLQRFMESCYRLIWFDLKNADDYKTDRLDCVDGQGTESSPS